jgi:hypothetical protein
VSPLLYDEPRDDALATTAMFESLLPDAPWNHSLRQLLRDAKTQTQPLTWLRGRLRLSAFADNPGVADTTSKDRSIRRNMRLLASLLILVGLLISVTITWISVRRSRAQSPPALRAGNLVSPAGSP